MKAQSYNDNAALSAGLGDIEECKNDDPFSNSLQPVKHLPCERFATTAPPLRLGRGYYSKYFTNRPAKSHRTTLVQRKAREPLRGRQARSKSALKFIGNY